MNVKWILILICLSCCTAPLLGQSSVFGVKGGPLMGVQQWNSFDRDPLFKFHVIGFVETFSEEDLYSIFAQLGYHVKGSAIRNQQFTLFNGNTFRAPTQEFQFRNLSLVLGFKKKYMVGNNRAFYSLGLRGDYTLNTNLDEYQEINQFVSFYPSDNWVNKWNYGVTFGGGFEFPFAELVEGLIEFTVNPDFSRQYWQPTLPNVPDPRNPGQTRSISERKINNITFEITLGFRFLRIVEYVD